MKYFAPFRLRVEKDAIKRVTRSLKGIGRINVVANQQVSPDEIIGKAMISVGFRTVNLAQLLSVSAKDVTKFLTKKIGDKIYKGELLAFKKGNILVRKKEIIAPTDGILDFFNSQTGELKISFLPKEIKLPAGVYGIVEEVDQERGKVVIRTQVSLIYGVFGSGKNRDGILTILNKEDSLINKSDINLRHDGQILVGGSIFFKDAISAAISSGVTGIISGGINASDYQAMVGGRLIFPQKLENDIGVSLVFCEGFGSIPIGEDIFDLLKKYAGRFVFIDGNNASVNLPSFESSSLIKVKNTRLAKVEQREIGYNKFDAELKLNSKVRVVGSSYTGEQGKVIAIDNCLTTLASGIRTFLATIETPGRKIQVPVANLEIIM